MSRLAVAIAGKTLWSTGDVLLRVELDLLLKNQAGNWKQETFRVDTGTEMTTLPAYLAKQLGLPMPLQAAVGAVHSQTGLEIRAGYLRFQIVGMGQTEYVAPCFFLGDPNTPLNPNQPATLPRKLLQPFSLLDRLRFLLDHDPGDGTPHGTLAVEKK